MFRLPFTIVDNILKQDRAIARSTTKNNYYYVIQISTNRLAIFSVDISWMPGEN